MGAEQILKDLTEKFMAEGIRFFHGGSRRFGFNIPSSDYDLFGLLPEDPPGRRELQTYLLDRGFYKVIDADYRLEEDEDGWELANPFSCYTITWRYNGHTMGEDIDVILMGQEKDFFRHRSLNEIVEEFLQRNPAITKIVRGIKFYIGTRRNSGFGTAMFNLLVEAATYGNKGREED